jgi:hypothetical protein
VGYNYEGIAQTQKGRIIYDRKKHLFKCGDLLRIYKALPPIDNPEIIECHLVVAAGIISELNGLPDFLQAEGELAHWGLVNQLKRETIKFEGFGGGAGGGAGATGFFGVPWSRGD